VLRGSQERDNSAAMGNPNDFSKQFRNNAAQQIVNRVGSMEISLGLSKKRFKDI
jgi:hypothetical protein